MEQNTVAGAARVTGLTAGQISSLIFHGVIEPGIHAGNGIGDSSILSFKNIKELKLVARLKAVGVKRDAIKNIIKLLTISNIGWWEQEVSYVVIVKDSWFITDNVFSVQNKQIIEKEAAIIVRL